MPSVTPSASPTTAPTEADEHSACLDCMTVCAILPPAGSTFPCYQGTPSDANFCYYSVSADATVFLPGHLHTTQRCIGVLTTFRALRLPSAGPADQEWLHVRVRGVCGRGVPVLHRERPGIREHGAVG
jgi:hypothetical protein